MGTVYFVRHGQTYWNAENKICGATDIEPTPLGHEQAIKTGQMILEKGIRFDEIISSPLVRAAETARHISEITGIPMRLDERLKEQNFGRFEATARDGKEFRLSKEHFADWYDGGDPGFKQVKNGTRIEKIEFSYHFYCGEPGLDVSR